MDVHCPTACEQHEKRHVNDGGGRADAWGRRTSQREEGMRALREGRGTASTAEVSGLRWTPWRKFPLFGALRNASNLQVCCAGCGEVPEQAARGYAIARTHHHRHWQG